MDLLRPDLATTLSCARALPSGDQARWLDDPPVRATRVVERCELPDVEHASRVAESLMTWELHRRSGLRVLADGRAAPGVTVALAWRAGPVWVAFACRVTATVEEPGRTGFTYVTLPGHPEHGVESFTVTTDDRPQLELVAVSRHAHPATRLMPAVGDLLQRRATRAYLRAAQDPTIGRAG